MKFGNIRKSLLISCLIVSVALHIGAVWFIYSHPFQFASTDKMALVGPAPSPTILHQDDAEALVQRMEKALEESLNTIVALTPKENTHIDLAKAPPLDDEEIIQIGKSLPPKQLFASSGKMSKDDLAQMQSKENDFATNMPPLFDPEFEASLHEFALDDELEEDPFTYKSEKYASIDFSDSRNSCETPGAAQIIEDDLTMTDQQFCPSALPTHRSEGLDPHFVSSLQKLKTPRAEVTEEMSEDKMFNRLDESTTPNLILPNSVDYLRSQWIKRSLAEQQLPDLDYYGLEEITTTLQWEEDIDIDIALMPAPEGNKYIFSLTIHPEFETDCQTMHQNFYFIIDRSSSIEKHKFSRFKRAVQRSLAALCEGDHFNIYIFDKNVVKLSDRNLPVTPKTIQMAEDYLDHQSGKTHFAATEVYTSLEKMLPDHFDPDELHSVILITDGNTLLSSQKQQKTLSQWAKKYDGAVNFYTAAAGKGNNLVLLDLLSYSTAGKMLYSDTNAGFPRKLVRLVKDLHNPIVKNISIDISPSDSGAKVTLYPRNQQQLPPMFAQQPYTVVGTIDELCDLTLFIQGRNHDKWLNIRKQISLRNATRTGRSLEKLWANTQSKICYDHFLKNGKNTHLKEAKQIVAPYRGVIATDQ
ncbi:MAG: hypothetical protein K1000chlam2_00712 [Chlamydiae bacterium]|nr:hypothetical protein [Chlamydiota bacterium]